jgi:hypothetical protein
MTFGSSDVIKAERVCVCVCVCARARVCVCVCVCLAGTVLLFYLGLSSVSYFIYFDSRLRLLQIECKKKIEVTKAHKPDIALMGDIAKTQKFLADCEKVFTHVAV